MPGPTSQEDPLFSAKSGNSKLLPHATASKLLPQATASQDAHNEWMKGWWQGQALKKLAKEKKYEFLSWSNVPDAYSKAKERYRTVEDVMLLVNR